MPNFIIQNHWLIGATHRPSPNVSGVIKPEIVVFHYTGSQSTAGALEHLTNPSVEASAHIVISPDGDVHQLVAFNKKAWHAGESTYKGRPSVNSFSVGIELVNPGPLKRGDHGFQDLNGQIWRGEVLASKHSRSDVQYSHWAAYGRLQLAAAFDVLAALVDTYGVRDITGHDAVTLRKMDPGPAFPMATFRKALGTAEAMV